MQSEVQSVGVGGYDEGGASGKPRGRRRRGENEEDLLRTSSPRK